MKKTPTILVAEDCSDDVVLMKLAFKKAGLLNPIHVVSNGVEAIEYLQGALQAKKAGCHAPLLVSLDLNMPLLNGIEVLRWIKKQPALKQTSVLVMSQSKCQNDKARAIRLGAQAYLVKPSSFDKLVEMVGIYKNLLGQLETKGFNGNVAELVAAKSPRATCLQNLGGRGKATRISLRKAKVSDRK